MSTMLSEIQKAFEARIGTLTTEPVVAWEGVSFTPQKHVPYISVSMAGRARMPMGVGPNTAHIWNGVLRVLVNHPANEALAPLYSRVGQVLAHFPTGLTLTLPSPYRRVIVNSASPGPAYNSADWITVPVDISWFAEEPTVV